MKKGLIILSTAFAVSSLLACNKNKVTAVKVQALPYVLMDKWYQVGLTVEGQGTYSKDIKWSSNDEEHLTLTADNFMKYENSELKDPKEVEITATSKQDATKKASVKVTVLPITGIEKAKFLDLAKQGDEARKGMLEEGETSREITAIAGTDDYVYGPSGLTKIDNTKFNLLKDEDTGDVNASFSFTYVKPGSSQTEQILNSTYLTAKLNRLDTEKIPYSCFEYVIEGQGAFYGYYMYESEDETHADKLTYTVYQYGLLSNYMYFEGTTCYDYLNLTAVF